MRVLALTHAYLPGHCAGAETMLHSMLRALLAAGHEADVVLSTQTGDPYEVDGVNVHPRRTKQDAFGFLPAADLIISHLASGPQAAALGKWNRIPVVVLNHNTWNMTKKVVVAPQGQVDLVVVNSQWMADDFNAWVARQRPKRVAYVPPVIICRPLPDLSEHATTPGDMVTLINPTVDTPGGPDGVLIGKGGELFRRLAELMPDVGFLGVTGGYGRQQDLTGLSNVTVLPHVPHSDMRERVWSRTRILLMPSAYESWGRAASEALCSGIPVIAHSTLGLVENLGDAGIFVDRNDTDGWVRELRRLKEPGEYAQARARSLARAAEHQAMRTHDEEVWVSRAESLVSRRHSVAALAGA